MNSPAGGGAHNTGSGGHVLRKIVHRGDPALFKETK